MFLLVRHFPENALVLKKIRFFVIFLHIRNLYHINQKITIQGNNFLGSFKAKNSKVYPYFEKLANLNI